MFIITGGGTGIGKALALALAKRGKSVLIVGRREPLLQQTAATSSLISYCCADVSTDEGRQAIRLHINQLPSIEALVNNAGIITPIISLKEISIEDWRQTLSINVDAPLFLTQLLQDKLANGRVLNISSGAAYFATRGWGAYSVSKAAVSMLTRCCQLEFESLAFASVMPGIIDTAMQEIIRQGFNMDIEQTNLHRRLKEHHRLITPETVAEFLAWLLLDTDTATYSSQEWDIYDTAHHAQWLKPPHQILHWDF